MNVVSNSGLERSRHLACLPRGLFRLSQAPLEAGSSWALSPCLLVVGYFVLYEDMDGGDLVTVEKDGPA